MAKEAGKKTGMALPLKRIMAKEAGKNTGMTLPLKRIMAKEAGKTKAIPLPLNRIIIKGVKNADITCSRLKENIRKRRYGG